MVWCLRAKFLNTADPKHSETLFKKAMNTLKHSSRSLLTHLLQKQRMAAAPGSGSLLDDRVSVRERALRLQAGRQKDRTPKLNSLHSAFCL